MQKITTLRDETRELLLNRPATLKIQDISEALDVSSSWLNTFARGALADPGVVKIQTLNAYLRNIAKKGTK